MVADVWMLHFKVKGIVDKRLLGNVLGERKLVLLEETISKSSAIALQLKINE